MQYRYLGNTGLRVSAIAMGCEGFMGKTPEQVISDFDFAESLGINFFDCHSSNPDLSSASSAASAKTGVLSEFTSSNPCSALHKGSGSSNLACKSPIAVCSYTIG